MTRFKIAYEYASLNGRVTDAMSAPRRCLTEADARAWFDQYFAGDSYRFIRCWSV